MEDFKNTVIQAALSWLICTLGYLAFGLVIAVIGLIWNFFDTYF